MKTESLRYEGILFLSLIVLLWTSKPAVQWWEFPESVRFVSPRPGTTVVAEQLPVLVRLPGRLRHASARLMIDGVAAGADGLVRRRWWEGKGADFIGEVSTAELSPGWHTLQLRLEAPDGEVWALTSRFRYDPLPHRLEIWVRDEAGRARSARVEVFDAQGKPFHTGSRWDGRSDPTARDAVRSSRFVMDGVGHVRLPHGQYTLLASGGIRDGVQEVDIQIPRDRLVSLTVPRLIWTPSEITADLHVHTGASGDAFMGDTRRFDSLITGGVEMAVITDHNQVRDPRPALELLDRGESLGLVPGIEFRVGPPGESIGHGNAFPIAAGTALPHLGDGSPAEVMAAWRAHGRAHPPSGMGAGTLIQINHPRGIQFWPSRGHQYDAHALFSALGLRPGQPLGTQTDPRLYVPDPASGERLMDMDALEILNRYSVEGWLGVRQDWFDLMNQGWFPTGTGNADSHTVELDRPGFPVNLVQTALPDRQSPDALVRAIRSGRVSVSSGPIVRLRVVTERGPDASPGDILVGSGSEAWAEVEVLAAPWVPVPEVRLIVDGVVAERVALPGGKSPVDFLSRGRWRWRVPADRDTWVLAEAGWPLHDLDRPTAGVYARVAPGHVPIGFTNPVRIDGDADGKWTPRIDPQLPQDGASDTIDALAPGG